MEKGCLLLDTNQQQITYKSFDEETFIEVEHEDGWYIRVPIKEINQIKAANTTTSIISPYSFLYVHYKEDQKDSTLWGAILHEHIFLVIFKDSKPIFFKISAYESQNEVQEVIEHFIRDFFEQENSFFIERIKLYYERGAYYEDPDLSEELMLPIEFTQIDYEKICINPKITHYYFPSKKEPGGIRLGINKRFVLGVGFSVILFLLGYDFYLRYQIDRYDEKIKGLVQTQVELANENNEYQSKMLKVSMIKPQISQILGKNELLEQKIRSIFDLVPDDTYLIDFVLRPKELQLSGVSRYKESFLQNLHKKLTHVYDRASFELINTGIGYYFRAIYKEGNR